MKNRVIIDTDPGIDDAAAILFALASPEFKVDAITTVYGNGTVAECTRNALIVLEAAKRKDIPVYRGVDKPLMREPHIAHFVHGNDALGDVGIPNPNTKAKDGHAVWELIKRVMAAPGEITLFALGPMTNIALALSIEPRMAVALQALVLMGGAVFAPGNATEVASANLYNDPEAAAILYRSGAPIVQVGLDVCNKVRIRQEHFDRIEATATPVTNLLARITPHLIGYYQSRGSSERPGLVGYNDMPAIAYALAPELFSADNYQVRIATHDELTRGQTIVNIHGRDDLGNSQPNATVLMDVDAEAVLNLFMERVVEYQNPAR